MLFSGNHNAQQENCIKEEKISWERPQIIVLTPNTRKPEHNELRKTRPEKGDTAIINRHILPRISMRWGPLCNLF